MTNRIKILVAEDNIVQRAYLSKLIEALGFDPVPAQDGQEALDLVRSMKVQIVISDYQMPKLNGIELTQAIRALELDHYVYIVMITGSEEDSVKSLALDVGVDDFLNKTRSPVMLNARIRAAIRLINHAEELAERTRVLKESNDHIREDLRAAAAAQRQLLPDIKKDLLGFTVASAFVPSSSLVANLNNRFCGSENDEYFTMFCGVIDTQSGQLDYCQAGYPSPYNVAPTGDAQPVGTGGFPVGMLDFATYENETTAIEKGGALVVSGPVPTV